MQNFKPGTDVPITFSFTDEAGAVLTPVTLRWRVMNASEVEVQAWASVPLPDSSELTVVIPAALTVLPALKLRNLLVAELEVTTATGTVQLSESVMLQGVTALSFGVNTFQTYGEAILNSEDFTPDQITGWVEANRENREKALIQAYQNVLQLPIGMRFDDSQSALTEDPAFISGFGARMLRGLTPVQMGALYPKMLADLEAAQLIQADHILVNDPIARARESGMTSNTVGDSSQFYRATKPLDLPVCPRAMARVQRWVRFGTRAGRS